MIEDLDVILSSATGSTTAVIDQIPVSGGNINEAFQLKTSQGDFVLKTNSVGRYSALFETEVAGLQLLRDTGCIAIPKLITHGETDEHSYLILEYVAETQRTDNFWRELGTATAAQFGLDHDNFIGTLAQRNAVCDDWVSFFVSARLEPLAKQARDTKRLANGDAFRLERLYNRLDGLIPTEQPALLHGDLWTNNQLCGPDAKPYLIDPAVYFGHREMDIAMSLLFGGFDATFYEAYNHQNPLETGWQERVAIHNLYPLLVHALLFGGSYTSQITRTLKQLV